MIWTAVLCLSLLAASVADAPAGPVTISLRATVRIAADVDHVRLADIATLEGEVAGAIGEIVVGRAPRSGATAEFSLRQIREALDGAGVHWGRTHLNGRSVVVRAAPAGAASPPLPMASLSLVKDEDEPVEEPPKRRDPAPHLASDLLSGDDLRSAIAEFMLHNLNLEPDGLQLAFDERDEALLQTPLASQRFEIEPASSVRSGRVELAIRRWEGERILDRRTINVAPTVRTQVAVLARDVDRGAGVTSDDLELHERWLAPNVIQSVIGDPSSAIGRMTSTRLREGDLLRETHLQRETVMRRGELVIVRCIVGGAVISLQAEARANAAIGETIEFRKPGDRDTFLATVTGRGAAVVDLSRRNQ